MNRLADIPRFPIVVNAGVILDVLLTVALMWYIEPRYPELSGPWMALVLVLNSLPVLLLCMSLQPATMYLTIRVHLVVRGSEKI